ncbi:MAG: antibiotic biosynthesis monooxygenase [Gammaproteobacteria bacterium]|nr:antibiotic biosynthesis monooxygenase [Gammaproteobacteria bacterium]
MSITRINEFHAKDGRADDLRKFLTSVIPAIESSAGCQSCQLLQSLDDPTRLVVVETWESVEAHQTAVKSIPPNNFAEIMKMLAETPKSAYFRSCDGK